MSLCEDLHEVTEVLGETAKQDADGAPLAFGRGKQDLQEFQEEIFQKHAYLLVTRAQLQLSCHFGRPWLMAAHAAVEEVGREGSIWSHHDQTWLDNGWT